MGRRVAAVLTAAGSGERLGHSLPKALVAVGGEPLVVRALRGLTAAGVADVVVTCPPSHHAAFEHLLSPHGASCVPGGPTRQSSVAAGLAALAPGSDVVLVHDAARALTPPDVVRRVVDAVLAGARAVIPVVPLTDSVVSVVSGVAPVDRASLRAVQTPQGFDRAVLQRAHAAAAGRAGDDRSAATDDASMCAAIGEEVTAVEGDLSAFKITTPRDLLLAEALLGVASP